MTSLFSRSFTLISVLVCVGLLSACQRQSATPEPVRAVKLITVGQGSSLERLEFSGEVRARVESSLGFRVPGKLLSRPVEMGQRVRAGQLLAQLDAQDYEASAEAARAQLQAAQSNRDAVEADFRRYRGLFEQGFISRAELERREAAWKAAQAQWQQASAQLTLQGNQSAYTRLLAEGAGVVTSIDAQPGQVLAAGQPVVRLALDGARDVVFAVAEDKLGLFRAGQSVAVQWWGRERVLGAQVRDIAGSADPVTRTFLIKAALPADAQDLVLGSTVTVRQASRTQDRAQIRLPGTALRLEGGQTSVWVLDAASMTVRLQAIEVVTADGNDAVVRSGLQAGDEVVISGVHALTPGQKVTRYVAR